MWHYNNTDELQHWGIKGMRWGVRRFQNNDGSLTSAGKKRYTSELERDKVKAQKRLDKAKTERGRQKAQENIDRLSKADPHIYSRAKSNQRGRKLVAGMFVSMHIQEYLNSPRGKRMIDAGTKAVKDFMASEKARQSITKIVQNPKFNPIDGVWKFVD